jgi:hypothetical protein
MYAFLTLAAAIALVGFISAWLLRRRPDDVLDVDVEKHLRWLETGEGSLWPPVEL